MLNFSFLSFFFCLLFLLFFYFICAVYFILLKQVNSKFVNCNDVLQIKKKNLFQAHTFEIFFKFFKISYSYLFFFALTFRSFSFTFFFKHVSLEEFNYSVFFLILFSFYLIIIFFENQLLSLKKVNVSHDFFTALWCFFFIAPFSVFANTLLTFFFFLELISLLVLYLIIAAKDFYAIGLKQQAVPTAYFNTIFFHFWASFFSSILLVYSMLNLFFIFGTTEWVFLNFFLENINTHANGALKIQTLFNLYLLFFAIIIKMGISPFFFFKIEIYKAMPLFLLFFYSIFYFFIYFFIFFLLFFFYFPALLTILSAPIFFFLVGSAIVFIVNLFNIYLLKNFFAISSLINSILFFFLVFSSSF
jgi:hypothetical protein